LHFPYGIVDLANKLFRGPRSEVWINHEIAVNCHTVHAR
jgi:hypothetical protein